MLAFRRYGLVLWFGLVFSFFTTAVMAQDQGWSAYKSRFLMPDGRIIDTANKNVSHTEGQGFSMLRLQIQRLAIKTLSLSNIALDFTEQPQPIEHLRDRLMLLQVTITSGPGFSAFTLVGETGNGREQGCHVVFACRR